MESSRGVIARKVKRVLELRSDTPEMTEALDTITDFWSGNTAENRRNLRSDLERSNVAAAEEFLAAFAPVRTALLSTERRAASLETQIGGVLAHLAKTDCESKRVIAEHDALAARCATLTERETAVSCFLGVYRLTDDEAASLAEAELDVLCEADAFFSALARAHSARERCASALTVSESREAFPLRGAAAFELLDRLSSQHEAAYERLYLWTVAKLGGNAASPEASLQACAVSERDANDASSSLRKAVRQLTRRAAFTATPPASQREYRLSNST